jgi:hypothetical protein
VVVVEISSLLGQLELVVLVLAMAGKTLAMLLLLPLSVLVAAELPPRGDPQQMVFLVL